MRKDMSKVIVERPRRKLKGAKSLRAVPLDQTPAKQGLKRSRRERGGYKELNENLAPLRRYLEKQVGRPWDKVYSEICENLRADNTVQQHVRDHLKDFVRYANEPLKTYYRGDAPWRQPLYVDDHGLLKRTDQLPAVKAARRARKSAPKPEPDIVPMDARHELRRIDGIWWVIELAPLPEAVYGVLPEDHPGRREANRNAVHLLTPPVNDIVRGPMNVGPLRDTRADWTRFKKVNPRLVYAVGKRQAPGAELRRRGLKNSDVEVD